MRDRLFGRQTRQDGGHRNWWSFVVIVPLLMFVVQLDACTGTSINEEDEAAVRENTAQAATVNELLSNSDAYYGAEVTVTGEVTEVITPLTFELNGDINSDSTRYGESADGLLVVKNLESTSDPEVEVGDTVEVSGTVRAFDIGPVEEEIDQSLAGGVFTYWADQTSVIATSVDTAGDTTAS